MLFTSIGMFKSNIRTVGAFEILPYKLKEIGIFAPTLQWLNLAIARHNLTLFKNSFSSSCTRRILSTMFMLNRLKSDNLFFLFRSH